MGLQKLLKFFPFAIKVIHIKKMIINILAITCLFIKHPFVLNINLKISTIKLTVVSIFFNIINSSCEQSKKTVILVHK